jgi:hypothetical protein
MKKILLGILLCGGILTASAQVNTTNTTTTTTTTHKYYYYPSSNVYFDESTGSYWYQDKGTTQWTKTQTLPSTITVEKTSEEPMTYSGTDPWQNNNSDVKKFKIKKNGTVKMKTKKKDD